MRQTDVESKSEQFVCPACETLLRTGQTCCAHCRQSLEWLNSTPEFRERLTAVGYPSELRIAVEWPDGETRHRVTTVRSEDGPFELAGGPAGLLQLDWSRRGNCLAILDCGGGRRTIELPSHGTPVGPAIISARLAVSLEASTAPQSIAEHRLQAIYVGDRRCKRFGRRIADDADSIQLADQSVKLLHAVAVRQPGSNDVWLARSEPGADVFVNRQPIAACRLNAGDLVQIGPFAWVFSKADGFLAPVNYLDGLRLELRGVGLGDRLDVPALTINAGQFVAITGPSGSGKSTLLKAVLGAPGGRDRGVVLADDRNIDVEREWYGSQLGYVSQEEDIHADLTARQAAAFRAELRCRRASSADVEEALLEVDLPRLRRNAAARSLSGGERKRLRIAAELIANPRLLVLDEPGSGLDGDRERSVMTLLRSKSYCGVTVVIVTHNLRLLKHCDRVLVVLQGRIRFNGTPDDLAACAPGGNLEDVRFDQWAASPADNMRAATEQADAPSEQEPGEHADKQGVGALSGRRSSFRRIAASLPRPFRRLPANRPVGAFRKAPAASEGRAAGGSFASQAASILDRLRFGASKRATQAGILVRRELTLIGNSWIRRLALPVVLVPAIFACAIGISVQPRDREMLGFLSILAAIWMGASLSLMAVADEREAFEHERLSFLLPGCFIFAKTLVLWLMAAGQVAVFLPLMSLVRKLHGGGMLYGWFGCGIGLGAVASAAVGAGLLLSAVSGRDKRVANFVLPLLVIVQILFSVRIARSGDQPLHTAYGEFNFHRCQAGPACHRRAEYWAPGKECWTCKRCFANPLLDDADPTADESYNKDRPRAWAATLSYLTFSRYADIALRSFAYRKQDFEAAADKEPGSKSEYAMFAYGKWRRESLGTLLLLAVSLPSLAGAVLWRQTAPRRLAS